MIRLRLKELYEKHGISQNDVHKATGIRASTLSGLANNHRSSWDLSIVCRLLHYFEIKDISELIELDSSAVIPDFEKMPTVTSTVK